MAYFAELNAEGVCIAVSEQPRVPAGPRFVALDALDYSLLRKRRVDGEWLPPQAKPAPAAPKTPVAKVRKALRDADLPQPVTDAIEAMLVAAKQLD